MNKLFTKIATLIAGLSMAIGVGVAVESGRNATRVSAADAGSSIYTSGTPSFGSAYAGGVTKTLNSVGWYFSNVGNNTSMGWNKSSQNKNNLGSGPLSNISETTKIGAYQSSSPFTNAQKITVTVSNADSVSGNWYVWYSTNGSTWTKGTQSALSSSTTAFTYDHGSKIGDSVYFAFGYGTTKTTGTRINLSGIQVWEAAAAVQTYTVSFAVNTAGYGTVSSSSIANVPSGTSISTSNNTVTINGTTVTATPTTNTAQYTYAFSGWSNNTGTVTADRTITANFTRTTNTFTVGGIITNGSLSSTDNIEYGGDLDLSVLPSSGYTYPASISVTMGGSDISDDVLYDDSDGSVYYTPVTGNIVVSATCPAAGNTYSITTTVTNGTYSGSTSITDNGGVASVTIAPTGDYKLPTSVTVSGADHTYNSSTGVISLSNATGNVTISAAMVALTEYTITVNETNGTHTGASTIKETKSASLTFTPSSGYGQPSSVTVSGATSTWTRGTGVLSLSNPTGNVTVTYAATENELDSITLSINSGNYTLGDDFVKPTVTAHYTVANDANVTSSATYSGYNPYTTGSQSVTISYTEGGITKTASYTATVAAASVATTTTWELASLNSLTADDEFVIVGDNGSTYAMSNNNGASSAPSAVEVTISNDKITSTVENSIKWNVTGDSANGYIFYPNGSTETWLYCNNSNNGVRVGTGSAKHIKLNGYLYTEETTSTRYLGIYSSQDWRCYTSNGGNIENQTFAFYKKVETQTGSADLIRITASYNGGDKYVGDSISTSDFIVKKQLNTGNDLIAVDSGFTISENTLTSTSNTITVSYTEGSITKTADVVISATERSASVTSVTLVQGSGVVKNYIDWSGTAWDYTGLTVHCVWDDEDFNEDLNLADLVQSGDATVSPAKPAVGVTSFTVSYTYHEMNMTSNTVSGITVVADYVSSVSWAGKSKSHFKAFSGEQLTAATVGLWTVKATYAGAGESSALSFGTNANQFTIRIGDSKSVTSLPYTWDSDDNGKNVYVVVGGVAQGDAYGNNVANICTSLNTIDHTESETVVTPIFEYTLTTSVPTMSTGDTKQVIIAANVSNTYYALKTVSNNKADAYTPTVSNSKIASDDADVVWKLTKIDGGYTISNSDDKFLAYTSSTNIVLQDNSYTWSITAVSENGSFRFASSTSGRGLHYRSGSVNKFGGYSSGNVNGTEYFDLELFIGANTGSKEETVETTTHYANQTDHFDAQKAVVEFSEFVNETMNGTNVCSGTFANLSSAWSDVADKYDELFGEDTTLSETELAWALNMLKYASANWDEDHDSDNQYCLERAMRTYEVCVQQHKLTAFMDTVRPLSSNRINPIAISSNTNTAAVIIIVSVISAAAIGGYFFLRKRKEEC